MPSKALAVSLCLLLLTASPALAQEEDSPYSYSDDDSGYEEEQPRRSRYADPGEELREAAEQEGDEPSFKKMYRVDDPNTGVAAELLGR